MKLLIASDVHGSDFYLQKLLNRIEIETPDKIALLGDIYYHGPRNALPEGYNPMAVCEKLNALYKKYNENLIALQGNCDAEVDQTISDFTFVPSAKITVGKNKVYLSHGQKYNKDNLPKVEYDVFVYAHFHTGFIEKIKDKIIANCGSVSIPRNDTPHSYLVIDEKTIEIKDLDGKTVISREL